LLLPVAAAVLVLAVGQSDSSRERRTGEGAVAPAGKPPAPEELRQPTGSDHVIRLSGVPYDVTDLWGVPYMPSVGALSDATRGVFLDVALLSAVRAQVLAAPDTVRAWGEYLEVTPGIALEVGSPRFSLSLGYAPRLTVPFNVGGFQLAVLNRATLLASWRASPLWTVTASGIIVVGDYSQLNPSSTPGGPGPPPPILNPVRSFQTYSYVDIDTRLAVDGTLSARSRIRLAGGYFDVGGVGPVGQANQPRTWGPLGEAAFVWDASRTSTLTTAATARSWMMVGDYNVVIATLTESWRQSWTSELETTLAAGPGLSNRDVESPTGAHHLVPVASFRLDYIAESRQSVRLSLGAALAPFVDAYIRIPSEQFTLRGSLDWSPSDAWHLGGYLSAALANNSSASPGSYGDAGLSASYAPVQPLILSIGAYSQVQFQGATAGVGAFRQFSMYFSLALRDRFSL